MADGVRRVYAGKRGPIGNADEVPLAFLLSSIAAELRDARARLVRWSPSRAKSVPLDGVSQHAVDGIHRALMLVELAEKHCAADSVIRESLVSDTEPATSAERDQRNEDP